MMFSRKHVRKSKAKDTAAAHGLGSTQVQCMRKIIPYGSLGGLVKESVYILLNVIFTDESSMEQNNWIALKGAMNKEKGRKKE